MKEKLNLCIEIKSTKFVWRCSSERAVTLLALSSMLCVSLVWLRTSLLRPTDNSLLSTRPIPVCEGCAKTVERLMHDVYSHVLFVCLMTFEVTDPSADSVSVRAANYLIGFVIVSPLFGTFHRYIVLCTGYVAPLSAVDCWFLIVESSTLSSRVLRLLVFVRRL